MVRSVLSVGWGDGWGVVKEGPVQWALYYIALPFPSKAFDKKVRFTSLKAHLWFM